MLGMKYRFIHVNIALVAGLMGRSKSNMPIVKSQPTNHFDKK